MKTKRFSVEQIVAVLKEAEAGMPVAELIRRAVLTNFPVNSIAWTRVVLLSNCPCSYKT